MSIYEMIEFALHDKCKTSYPKLYSLIAQLVAAGQTANQIEAEIVRRNPAVKGKLTADMIRYTATVLQKRK